MHFNTFILYLFLILFSSSCISNNENKSPGKNDINNSIVEKVGFEIVTEKGTNIINISDISFDTVSIHNDTKGLLAIFNIKIASNAFDSLAFKGYNSYFIDLKCKTDEGIIYSHRKEIFKSSDKKRFIHAHKDFFISRPTERQLEVILPYRMLEMKEGNHDLTIYIEAFPAKFKSDTSSLEMKQLDKIHNIPLASVSLKIKVKAPKLYKTTITVHKFKLNTKVVNPDKFDFAMGGSGYPDLFWEIYCGNDYIYYSPVEKNKLEYNKKYISPTFYSTKEDIVNIAVVDYDNGPFNTQDDIIEKWEYKTALLANKQIDTLRFGKLDYWIFETKVE